MTRRRLFLLRRILLILTGLALAWAVAAARTGGFILELGAFRLSSRNPRNVLIIAVLMAAAVWRLSTSDRAGPFAEEWAWWQGRATGPLRALRTALHGVLRAVRQAAQRLRRLLLPLASAATVAVVGVAFDIYQWAGPPPFWLDEETIALNIRDRGFLELAGPLWFGQSAPLGWLVLQRTVLLTLGTSELVLRLVPLLFGIATVAAAVWIGARWMTRVGAAVLVLLCWAGALITHYRFEVKHYTADACWGLLLPALAMWALEGRSAPERIRRTTMWWAAAALGQFFANGAFLVTPACGLVLLIAAWRRDGFPAAAAVVRSSALWIVAFGAHYLLSIRYTQDSAYLHRYWASALPPEEAGVRSTVAWLAARVEPLAANPGGTALWASLWGLALAGFAFSAPRPLGIVLALTTLSAFVLAALGLVPLAERLSLWMVPSLYFSVALAVDRAVRCGTRQGRWRLLRVAGTIAVVVFAARLCADIAVRGWNHRELIEARENKQWLDDPGSVQWLLAQHQSGDAILATRLTWPAILWYGRIAVGDPRTAGTRVPDRGTFFEASHLDGRPCEQRRLGRMLQGHRRVLVYLGFRDERAGFEDLLLRELDDLGAIVALRQFSNLSRAAVVELEGSQSSDVANALPGRRASAGRPLAGCVNVRPAAVW